MKRFLILMAALLVFSGCAAEPEATTPTSAIPQTTAAAESTGTYAPDSMLVVSTSGSMQVYPLNRSDCSGVLPMGDDLLLFSGTENTTLTLLTGDELFVSRETTLNCAVDPGSPAVLVSKDGVTYYDETNRDLVHLDEKLEERSRTPMPGQLTGTPALTADRKTVYYCSADSLRSIDLESGIDKLLKEMSYSTQTVTGLHCGETVLQCTVTDSKGQLQTLFLSTLTGETLEQVDGPVSLSTRDEAYFAIRQDGAYTELIVGFGEEEAQLLDHSGDLCTAGSLFDLDGSVLVYTYQDNNTSRLDCFTLETGTRTASVNIPGNSIIRDIRGDAENRCIWFLRYDSRYECDILCRWDPQLNAVEDKTCYLIQRHTANDPDQEGLERCAGTAAALSEKYGVEVLIWTDIEAFQNEDASLTAEYQVPSIQRSLEQLGSALSCYPEGFLTQAAAATESGTLKICLVRSIESGEEAVQYWTDDSACIALCPDDNLEQNFHRELFFILENRVLGNCNTYDNWNSLNPDGFSYTLDAEAAETMAGSQWLEGEDRAFTDVRSMSFPREDRAGIMEYAITPGNEAFFESDTMQKKLAKLCTGIRKAFDLEDSEETFLWEQYLNQ